MKISSKHNQNFVFDIIFCVEFHALRRALMRIFGSHSLIVVVVGDIFAVIQIRYGLFNFIRHNKYSGTCVSADKNIH
jgi:hypothetical protein